MRAFMLRLDRFLNRLYLWSGYLAAFFLVCIAVLVHWVNSLQKQVDALQSDRKQQEKPEN